MCFSYNKKCSNFVPNDHLFYADVTFFAFHFFEKEEDPCQPKMCLNSKFKFVIIFITAVSMTMRFKFSTIYFLQFILHG